MKTFKFTSTTIVEADSEEEAKEKFADNSIDFAANAECEEEKKDYHVFYYDEEGKLISSLLNSIDEPCLELAIGLIKEFDIDFRKIARITIVDSKVIHAEARFQYY